ncbi:hypothetical protein LEP1GSC060_1181 [Leptospira weilii serovar Ranarum str. ICFT]|uniref:Uncharacterized protein n=1 Tax=Leptospira weilii serovar Ranarum str. ICFT TaxID=1218598 RepID=N1WBJ7_9LEPT|nr:hypothetical protein LEP1GSC060_1181 [Leptospira weilii serovar Ranarum str. ICFT]
MFGSEFKKTEFGLKTELRQKSEKFDFQTSVTLCVLFLDFEVKKFEKQFGNVGARMFFFESEKESFVFLESIESLN